VTATPPVDRRTGGAGSARTETQSIESDVAPDAVVALLADPRRLPEWAPAFADTVAGDAQSGWRAVKDGRQFELRVATSTDARTVDYCARWLQDARAAPICELSRGPVGAA